MRATIRDRSELEGLLPDDINAYLTVHGWKSEPTSNSLAHAWTHREAHDTLLVPSATAVADYVTRVAQLLRILEAFEDRSQLSIARDIALSGVDVVRLRFPEADSKRASIPLVAGTDYVERALDMLAAAAASAVGPRRVIPARRPQQAEDYLRTVELGQSERGSYILTVLSPVQMLRTPGAPGLVELWDAPFPRQVTRKLSTALDATATTAERVASGAPISLFLETIEAGVSANFCEALSGLIPAGELPGALEVSVSWASRYPEPSTQITKAFSPALSSVLRDAAAALREEAPSEGVFLAGAVTALQRREGHDEGTATVACVVHGVPRSLSVPLPPDAYALAIEAHRDQRAVLFSCDVVKAGRQHHAENVKHFRLEVRESDAP